MRITKDQMETVASRESRFAWDEIRYSAGTREPGSRGCASGGSAMRSCSTRGAHRISCRDAPRLANHLSREKSRHQQREDDDRLFTARNSHLRRRVILLESDDKPRVSSEHAQV